MPLAPWPAGPSAIPAATTWPAPGPSASTNGAPWVGQPANPTNFGGEGYGPTPAPFEERLTAAQLARYHAAQRSFKFVSDVRWSFMSTNPKPLPADVIARTNDLCLRYCLEPPGVLHERSTKIVTTCIIVAALMFSLSSGLLINPPSMQLFEHRASLSGNDVYIRVYFYGLFCATLMFLLNLIVGTKLLLLRDPPDGEELPLYDNMKWDIASMAAFLVVGLIAFVTGMCSALLASYDSMDATIATTGFGIIIAVCILDIRRDLSFWNYIIPSRRLAALHLATPATARASTSMAATIL